MVGCLWFVCFALTFHPPKIDRATVRCTDTDSLDLDTPSLRHDESAGLDQSRIFHKTWRVMSWDLGSIHREQSSHILHRQKRSILATLDSIHFDQEHSSPYVIMFQGVNIDTLQYLEETMRKRGGCRAIAPLWETPTWVKWFKQRGVDLYRSIWGSQINRRRDLSDRYLWVSVHGVNRDVEIKAERWSLPEIPERWPSRWFNQRPTALMFEVFDQGQPIRFVNVKLPDAIEKHQAGDLALRDLQRTPFIERLGARWMIMGDWRVSPPDTPPHATVNYRFQRFSIKDLYQGQWGIKMYPPLGSSSQTWGRWRLSLSHDPRQERTLIDHALSSLGTLKHFKMVPSELPWVGEVEERAPLWLQWSM